MSTQPIDSTAIHQFERIEPLVTTEFEVREALIEHGIPTFSVKLPPDSKQAFIRLVRSLADIGFTPVLRERNGAPILKVGPKPKTKPTRPIINLTLFVVTVVTVFITGYFLSLGLEEYGLNPWIGAASFTITLLGILGVHEMAHKFAANHHKMDASMPYFIPGPPLLGLGTFGAVILQKETPTNRDALFDIGASGPLAGLVIAIVVSAVGLAISPRVPITDSPPGTLLQTSLLFSFLAHTFVQSLGNYIILLHPIAFAGWVGLFITLLNLLPTGTLDGGHTLRSISNNKYVRYGFTLASILILWFTQQYLMLALVFFLSLYQHPGPLDDVSGLSNSRKLVSVVLLVVFALCLFLPREVITVIFQFLGL
jgi:membrane-associated protease RseP (regulator of RpoE activity)